MACGRLIPALNHDGEVVRQTESDAGCSGCKGFVIEAVAKQWSLILVDLLDLQVQDSGVHVISNLLLTWARDTSHHKLSNDLSSEDFDMVKTFLHLYLNTIFLHFSISRKTEDYCERQIQS